MQNVDVWKTVWMKEKSMENKLAILRCGADDERFRLLDETELQGNEVRAVLLNLLERIVWLEKRLKLVEGQS